MKDLLSDDFISFLVDETLKESLEHGELDHKKTDALLQFREYQNKAKPIAKGFLRSLKIFCDEYNIRYSEGSYRKEVKCFNLKVSGNELDIPQAWASFPLKFDQKDRGHLFSMQYDDKSLFPQVLSRLLMIKIKKIHCFHEREKCLFVFLDQFHIKKFEKYFESIAGMAPLTEEPLVFKRAS